MAQHRVPEPDDGAEAVARPVTASGARPEPVAFAATAQAVLAALVTLGWLRLDDATIAAIGTAVAAIAALVITLMARSKVTPLSNPRASNSAPLVPRE